MLTMTTGIPASFFLVAFSLILLAGVAILVENVIYWRASARVAERDADELRQTRIDLGELHRLRREVSELTEELADEKAAYECLLTQFTREHSHA